MSLRSSLHQKQVIHWLVLLSLLLGQFALGFGYGIAAERGNDQIKIPVCTSTGIQYIIWTPDGITQETGSNAKPAAGNCSLCTVSPPQFRFGIQDALLPEPLVNRATQIPQASQLAGPSFAFNPNTAPRAPPVV